MRAWAKRILPLLRRREGLLLGVALLLLLLFDHASPAFLQPQNLLGMTRHIAEIGIMSLGMTMVLLTAGIDLSVGSMLGLSAAVLGRVWQESRSLPLAILSALGVGLLAGAGNGWLVAQVGMPPLIVTLATLAIYRGLALGLLKAHSVHDFPEGFFWLGQGLVGKGDWGLPTQLVLWFFLAILGHLALSHTSFGRGLYAIGGNEEAARLSGLPVGRLKVLAYTLSGLGAAVAALVFVSRVSTAKADAGMGDELDVITAVVLGGVSVAGGEGSIVGATMGLLVIGLLRNGLTLLRVPREVQAVLIGGLLILTVMLDRYLQRKGVPSG